MATSSISSQPPCQTHLPPVVDRDLVNRGHTTGFVLSALRLAKLRWFFRHNRDAQQNRKKHAKRHNPQPTSNSGDKEIVRFDSGPSLAAVRCRPEKNKPPVSPGAGSMTPIYSGRALMRRLVQGLTFLALAAATFSWASAEDQEIRRAPAVAISQATGIMPAQLPGPGYVVCPPDTITPACLGMRGRPMRPIQRRCGDISQAVLADAWPYIGPFYPDPQVPLGWRKVTLKRDDGGRIWISKQSKLPAQRLPPPGPPAEVFDFLGGRYYRQSVDKETAFSRRSVFTYFSNDANPRVGWAAARTGVAPCSSPARARWTAFLAEAGAAAGPTCRDWRASRAAAAKRLVAAGSRPGGCVRPAKGRYDRHGAAADEKRPLG